MAKKGKKKKATGKKNAKPKHDEKKVKDPEVRFLSNVLRNASPHEYDNLFPPDSVSPEEWQRYAFACCKVNRLNNFLKWLLESKKVHLLVSNEKGNLLHAAIRAENEQLVKWLFDHPERLVKELFATISPDGLTPLEAAVMGNHHRVITLMMTKKIGSFWVDNELRNILHRSYKIAGEKIASHLKTMIKSAQIDSIRVHEDFDKLKDRLCSYDWWREGTQISLTEGDRYNLYKKLITSARNGLDDIIGWFLDEWQLPVSPPRTYRWEGLSLADFAAIGTLACSHVDDFMKAGSKKDFFQDTPLYLLHRLAAEHWDGKLETFKSTILSSYYESYEYLVTEYEDFEKNLHYKRLTEDNYQQRLEVIKLLHSKFPTDHLNCIPRLDVLVKAGQLQILKWVVSSGLINLDTVVGDPPTQHETEQEEDIGFQLDDNHCAICFCAKWNPYQLQCGHSFCENCIRQLDTTSEKCPNTLTPTQFQCPLCRRSVPLPVAMTVCDSFVKYLLEDSPWLQFEMGKTIGELLLGLAALEGSLFIFVWLIMEHKLNVRATKFKGQNVMHLASRTGRVPICHWLCVNGYADLVLEPDDNGVNSIHACIHTCSSTAELVFQIFMKNGVLTGDEWLRCALDCDKEVVVGLAKEYKAQQAASSLPEFFKTFPTLDEAIQVIKDSGLLDTYSDPLAEVFNSLFQLQRFDVLKWIFGNSYTNSLYFDKERKERISYLKYSNMIATKLCIEKEQETKAFLDEMENMELLKKNIFEQYCSLHKLLQKGSASFEDVCNVEAQQRNLFEQLPKEVQKRLQHTRIDLLKSSPVGGFDVLKAAFSGASLGVVRSLLDMRRGSFKDAISVYNAVNIFKPHPRLHLESMECVISWMAENGIPLDDGNDKEIPYFDDTKQEDNSFDTILEFFVWKHAHKLAVAPWSHEPLDGAETLLRAIRLLCMQPDIIAALNSGKSRLILFHYSYLCFHKADYSFENSELEVKISQHILIAVRLLMEAGASINSINEYVNNFTLIERLVCMGQPVHLKLIEWLALEKNVDIQFFKFGWNSCCELEQPEYEQQFKNLQLAQRDAKK